METEEYWRHFFESLAKMPMYFRYDFENCVVRTSPAPDGMEAWIKFQGEKEFLTMRGSEIVAEAVVPHRITTKEDYDSFI